MQEISGTIDDFREKGAWGALKDGRNSDHPVSRVQDSALACGSLFMQGIEDLYRHYFESKVASGI